MASEGTVRIGRFVVLAELATDASGTVYAAYDPQLDRKIALKVLTASTDAIEVRALARLRHPNVVAVHEVGTHRGERFIAMDLVDGIPLRTWLQSPRSGRQILDVLAQACSALAAAHAAAIVHRNFDADSVLVEHGQARVVGFATAVHDPSTDEAGDQLAFCTTMHAALAGVRVPSALRRALMRGLAADPAQRWPNMAALLHEITRPRRRRPLAIAITAAALAGTVAGALVVSASNTDDGRCAPNATRLDAIWNDATIAEIATAFAATDLAYAHDAWTRARDVIARWAESWSQQHHEACVATYEHGRQSEAMFDARMQCLERRLDELASLVDVLARPDESVVSRAVQASAELGSIDACADLDALGRGQTGSAAPPELFAELARVETGTRMGRYPEMLPDARALAATADREGFTDLAPAAHLARATLEERTGDLDAALASAHSAIERAEVIGDDRRRAEATISLVNLFAQQHHVERALEWVVLARATIARLDDPLDLRVRLSGYEGYALHVAGRFDEALARRREVLALREESGDELDPGLASAHSSLATTLMAMGSREEAREHVELALDLSTRALGERHPDVADAHARLGGVLTMLGDTDGAVRELQLAIDVATAALGPDAPSLGRMFINLGNAISTGRDPELAAPYYERGIAILEQARGPDNAEVGIALGNYGRLLATMPMPSPLRAIEVLTRARSLVVESLGPDHADLCYIDNHLAIAYLAAGQLDAAAAAADSAVRISIQTHGPISAMVAMNLMHRGDVEAARHDLRAAMRTYEEALAMHARVESRPAETGQIRFQLAKATAESGQLQRALSLARMARQEFVADAPELIEYVHEIDAWLAAHE